MAEAIRALPWRTDIPDRRPQRPHEHCRDSLVAGLAWSYCRRHRRWEAA